MKNTVAKLDCQYSAIEQVVNLTQGIPVRRYQNDNGMSCHLISPKHLDGLTLKGDLDEVKLANVDQGKYGLRLNDIVMIIRYKIGATSLVTSDFVGSIADNNLAVLRCKNSSQILPSYLVAILNSEWFYHNQLSAITGSSTVISISLSQLRKLKIPIPSLENQSKIADLLFAMDSLRQTSLNALKIRQQITEQSLFQLFGENV
ncbi:restriction endonuclease subunit S [Pseudanabaena sp. 'Roaring Creek']|uniref:restriction endonuclease subunit S n=1 Tax=Pseudanabaena sp. 'Roaring Creek' TaxID=1681830 RepID=UPI0006D7F2A9|nr:restriction endonuclease subunit S [Pseudanabaena sp. 'Roaring Creek']